MGKIKVGVFGAYRGQAMIGVLENHPDAELVAVCDKYRPLLDKVGAEAGAHGIQVALYERFEDFLAHDMDAVVLANYANQHAPFAIACLDAGKHVLSEVLPCESMAQAVALAEAVERSGKVYAYAENYSYMRHTFAMRQRYEAGEIGEVVYAEGEYIHDCAAIWPSITYGEKEHWRNRMYSTFYCTHSLGPILTITGRRPVQVTGFECPGSRDIQALGHPSGYPAGIEMVKLDNGAMVKSLHCTLKREPGGNNYQVYGDRGMLESRCFDEKALTVYRETRGFCDGDLETVTPGLYGEGRLGQAASHGGSDYYPTHFFLEKILGRPEGIRYSIDVYTALDMGICGILAYRSMLEGGRPVDVPDLRNPGQREPWRNDHACTDPEEAGDRLWPLSPYGEEEPSPAAYERVRQLWLEGKPARS